MPSINFGRRGKKGDQGHTFSGVMPSSGQQTQMWAPLAPDYRKLPNGRIVSLNIKGAFVPGVNTTGCFVMPFIMQHGGGEVDVVRDSWYDVDADTGEFPSFSAFPDENPNVLGLPLCCGYDYITTEFYRQEAATYIPGATPLTAVSSGDPLEWGKLTQATASDIVVGIASRRPGVARPWYTDGTNAFGDSLPPGYNTQVAVTGQNSPALTFYGFPSPRGSFSGTPAAAVGP
jgi:hypothetical protein